MEWDICVQDALCYKAVFWLFRHRFINMKRSLQCWCCGRFYTSVCRVSKNKKEKYRYSALTLVKSISTSSVSVCIVSLHIVMNMFPRERKKTVERKNAIDAILYLCPVVRNSVYKKLFVLWWVTNHRPISTRTFLLYQFVSRFNRYITNILQERKPLNILLLVASSWS